jgi:transposase
LFCGVSFFFVITLFYQATAFIQQRPTRYRYSENELEKKSKSDIIGNLKEKKDQERMMSRIRISVSKATVNELVEALQKAYRSGDAGMIKRIAVLLDFSRGDNMEAIAQRHGVSLSSIYTWIKKLLVEGVAGLKPSWKGGRPAKLTKSQKKELGELIDAGPEAAGFRSGCWNSAMIQQLI